MSAESVLNIRNIKKHFRDIRAVEDVSLSVKPGEIFGFVGPNGAGKTTTISMLLGLTRPTAGEIEIFGQRVTPEHNGILRRVGALVGSPALLLPFSTLQNLRMVAGLRPELPEQRIDDTLKLVGLQEAARRPVSKFSLGMKQRLGLALAIVNKPDLLILDEPTNGLDPAGMHEIRVLLRRLADRGVTIFFSSHLLHEVELICNRVAVVQRGRIIAQGAVKDLLKTEDVVRVRTADPERTAQALRMLSQARSIQVNDFVVEIKGVSSEEVMSYLLAQRLTPREVTVWHPDLESIFLELTQAETEKIGNQREVFSD